MDTSEWCERIAVAAFVVDDSGQIRAANARFEALVGGVDIVGRQLEAFAPAEVSAAGITRGKLQVRGGAPIDAVFRAFPVAGSPRLDVVLVSSAADSTWTADRAHDRAERMASLATLAAGTVHEIQDPLALVVTSLDLALRLVQTQAKSGADLVELATAVAAAREGAGQITDLTQGLSAFARGDDALRTPVDVERALDAAIALVRPSFRDKATLERSYESVPRVRAIERKLVQLFKSLLQNAGDAIEPGHKDKNRISIAVRRQADRVEVVIRDTGHGLSEEAKSHLFEPFFTQKPGALGLGLAAAHGIARSFGGELTLTETSDGAGDAPRGTTFTLVFPVSEAPVAATASSAPPARTSGRAHLLVIDDEERLAETLRMALAYSHDVTIATSGNDALAKIRGGTHPFDLVLCDLFLPDISGPDIYAEVERTRPDLLARFIFLTGGAFTESARRFLQNIDNPRLEKPFDLGALEDLISERLALFAR